MKHEIKTCECERCSEERAMKAAKIHKEWVAFHEIHQRYPTTREMDNSEEMKGSKYIQRNFGGVSKLREYLGLSETDFTRGEIRKKKIAEAIKMATNKRNEATGYLYSYFGTKPNVAAFEPYTDEVESVCSDFGIYHSKGHFYVNVICPSNLYNFNGCINLKLKKIRGMGIKDNVYYVCTNTDISNDDIQRMMKTKRNDVPDNVYAMGWDAFREMCEKLEPVHG